VTATLSARLAGLAQRYGLPEEAPGRLEALLTAVAVDGAAPTTVRDPLAAVDAHVADSLVALELDPVRGARRIADVGAGAGFPGLVLAAALPATHVTLVEASGRKCEFIRRAAEAAGLAAEVVQSRAEEWEAGFVRHDLVTARAVGPLAALVEYAAPLLAVDGALVAWKGRRDPAEEAAGERAAAIVGMRHAETRAVRPYPAALHRHLHLYLKVGLTPNRFPRRAGMARKRPLAGA
jgi:16S rRNA (guanine527-N7)-methyltransferase